MIATSDTAQYYVGTTMGRRRLAPVVSPGKTIEGGMGGLVAGAIVAGVSGPRLVPAFGLSAVDWAAIGATLALAGIVGDLFESLLKRGAGVKDASALIPGHGGALDRIDSYLFAGPVFYVVLRALA